MRARQTATLPVTIRLGSRFLLGTLLAVSAGACGQVDESVGALRTNSSSSSGFALAQESPSSKTLQPAGADPSADQQKELAELSARVDKLKVVVAPITQALERENDRTGKLRNELTGNLATGCFGKAKVEKLEILVKGSHLDLPTTFEISHQARTDEDGAKKVVFKFGDEFAYSHSDEMQQSIFTSAGRLALTEYSARRIRDFSFIKIDKGGVGWESVTHSYGCGIFNTSTCEEWRHKERYMFRLDSLTLKVNDNVLYKKDNINFTFKKDSLGWSDSNITANPAYIALMGRTDCPQTQ